MRRGTILMMIATLVFTLMVACAKVARQELPALDVIFYRTCFAVPLAAVVGARGTLAVQRPDLMVGRVVIGFGAMFGFFTAARDLAMADLAIISRLQPILVALLAPWLLGAGEEKNSRGVWLAVALGFGGAAVLTGPQLALGTVGVYFALFSTACSAVAHTFVRALGRTERPEAVVFWFQLSVFGMALVGLLAVHGTVPLPPASLWPYLVGCGVFSLIGQLLMTRAYAEAPAGRVAAATYVTPLWGVLGDVLLFTVFPSWEALIGGALVVVAGILLIVQSGAAPSADGTTRATP